MELEHLASGILLLVCECDVALNLYCYLVCSRLINETFVTSAAHSRESTVADLGGLGGYSPLPPHNLKEYRGVNVVIQKCTKSY